MDEKRTLGRALRRGLGRRCPNCGHRGVFEKWGTLWTECPNCSYPFEREEGYWVGALVINLGVAEILFGILFIGTIFLTLPDIPWAPLLWIALVTNLIVPILFYPTSKTLWMAIDLHFNPAGPSKP